MTKRSTRKRAPREKPDDFAVESGSPHVKARPHPLFAPPPSIVETVLFSRVGHTFRKIPQPFGPTLYAVQDFLLDQTGASGAVGRMAAFKAFDLTTAVSYRLNVLPKDRTKRILVKPQPGPVLFWLSAARRFVNAVADSADQYVSNSYFLGLSGAAPVFSYNAFSIGHTTNHWILFTLIADVPGEIVFNGFTTFGVYPPRSFDPGLKSYVPFSTSLPSNLPGSSGVPYLMFAYLTPDPVDPGPFVSLV